MIEYHLFQDHLFNVADVVYIIKKAKKGILDAIAIKEVMIKEDSVLYLDTYNHLWNEYDLCTRELAEELGELAEELAEDN